jgi:hypothetical protein
MEADEIGPATRQEQALATSARLIFEAQALRTTALAQSPSYSASLLLEAQALRETAQLLLERSEALITEFKRNRAHD